MFSFVRCQFIYRYKSQHSTVPTRYHAIFYINYYYFQRYFVMFWHYIHAVCSSLFY